MRALAAAIAVALSFAAGAVPASPSAAPRYLEPVRQELARLGYAAACEPDKGVCSFRVELEGLGTEVEAIAALNDATNTVYVAIPRFLPISLRDGPPLALARRLLDLNRRLVSSKLEWDALSGSVRLSTVLATDSQFDRKAFRSQVRALFAAAARLLPELEAIEGGGGSS
jgi:hypothetical protein